MKRLWFVAISVCFLTYQKFLHLVNSSHPSFSIDYQNDVFLLDGKPFR